MAGSIFLRTTQVSVREGNATLQVEIDRTGSLAGAVTIEYGIDGDSATAGADFLPGGGSVVMPDGVARVFVPVTILDDADSEATEVLAVSLVKVTGATLAAPRTERISILDDETPAAAGPTEPPLVSPYEVSRTALVSGLSRPVRFSFSPVDPGLVYVAEKGGQVVVADTRTGAQSVFLDLRDQVNGTGDRGLLDVALHPDFAEFPYVYVYYVADPADTAGRTGNAGPDGAGNRYAQLVRYTADAATGYRSVVPGSAVVLLGGAGQSLDDISGGGALDFTDPAWAGRVASDRMEVPGDRVIGGFRQDYVKVDSLSHAGGRLLFGPDGMLYVTTGDGASFNYADPRAPDVQSLDSLSGKVLRLDPMTGQGLADNPFAGGAADLDADRAKIFQLGLRNPFSAGFAADGRLFIGDVGWSTYEEVDSGGPGADFGWPYYEGGDGVSLPTHTYRDFPGAGAFYAGAVVTAPYRAFAHDDAAPGFQVQVMTAGAVVEGGAAIPAGLAGSFVFADFAGGDIYAVSTADPQSAVLLYDWPEGYGPAHMLQGPDGSLYYADLVGGEIGRFTITESSFASVVGTDGADTLAGNAGDTTLVGLGGADWLRGGTGRTVFRANPGDGDDTVDGSLGGDDTYSLEGLAGGAVVSLAAGRASGVQIGDDLLVGIEHVTGGAGADSIAGDGGGNRLSGMRGADSLDGGGGADTMSGGDDDDVLAGGAGDDSIDGDAGNDVFLAVAGDGNDTLDGGRGIDTYSLRGVTAGAVVSLQARQASGAGIGTDRLIAIENVEGGAGGDRITGTAGKNVVWGGAGDDTLVGLGGSDSLDGGAGADSLDGGAGGDTLDGGGGRDTLAGGGGDDTYVVGSAGVLVVEAVGGGSDTIVSGLGFLALPDAVENLVIAGVAGASGWGNGLANRLTGNAGADALRGGLGADTLAGAAGDDSLAGGAGNDSLDGGAGADSLNGGPGADSMAGGAGDDIYRVDAIGDSVVELPGAGQDMVVSTSPFFQLGDNIETLMLAGTGNLIGWGNAADNLLVGNGGANQLRGGQGSDTLDGGGGRDTLTGGTGADVFVLRAGEADGDVITDFHALPGGGGDMVELVGFGGAALVQVDATDWLISPAGGGVGELFHLANGAILAPLDVRFV